MSARPSFESLAPPGSVETIVAGSALVLAPHYDDEVLGCGGLVADLSGRGVPVRVVFASDGSGGVENVDDPTAYAARRRAEAEEAAEVLGVVGLEHLGLPDGRLERHGEELARSIEGALRTLGPDLLLLPGPLEVTPDHRAVFRSFFELAHPVRPGHALHPILEGLTILLYEVNHPAYPNVLVDVTSRVPILERAMACYESQQERHDYLGAALGLRRYRALSLPPGVEAAEGYRRLAPDDLASRSFGGLVAFLGGPATREAAGDGPLVSVIVRTRDRPQRLAQALESLARSHYRRLEVVLVNDGGAPPETPEPYPFEIRRVDLDPGRGRAGAANAGVEAARGDLVGFLDDDDLVYPEHFTTLVSALESADVRVAYSDAAVVRYELSDDGWAETERRVPYSRDFSADFLLLDNYIPFNTLLVERELLAAAGPFDPELPIFEDWDLLIRLSRKSRFHHVPRVTCEYRHFEGGGHGLGDRPREKADFLHWKAKVLERHRSHLDPQRLACTVDRLRAETVEAREAARSWRRDRDAARRELGEALDRAHRLNGEIQGLRGETERLERDFRRRSDELADQARETQRLYDEEVRLGAMVRDQEDHLRRTYEEIERLGELVESMRSTRAWRFHRWLERWRR